MRNIVCVVCFVLFAFACNAQSLNGTWMSDTTTLYEDKVKSTVSTFDNASKLLNELPVIMTFEDGSFHFTYSDGITLEGGFFIEDGILKLGTPNIPMEYKIAVVNDSLSIEIDNKRNTTFSKTK